MPVKLQRPDQPSSIIHQELNNLLDISRIINSTRDIVTILDDIQGCLSRLIPFTFACYYVKKGHEFAARHVIGQSQDLAIDLNSLVADNFLLDRIMATRRACKSSQIMSAEEIKQHPYYKRVLGRLNTLYVAGAPILVANIVMGSLTLSRDEEYGDFTFRDMQLLELVVNCIALCASGIERGFTCISRKSGPDGLAVSEAVNGRHIMGVSDSIRGTEALTTTFALVTNELRGPLANMKVALESLRLNMTNGMVPDLEHMENSLIRMHNIVKGLQSYTGDMSIQGELVNLNQVLDEALGILAPTMDPHVIIKKDYAESPLLYADREKMKRVFVNVIENSLEAMPGGGVLRVITALRDGHAYTIIEDNGLGVERDIRPRVFEPFVSSKVHGLGMGLPVSKKIIESHGGEIRIKSNLGKGTSVWIGVPIE